MPNRTPMRKLTHPEIAERRFAPAELAKIDRFPVFALLDDIRSLYNVGSIFRTADGVRLSRLILSGFTPHPPRKEIEKTALGATETVPWTYVRDPLEAIGELKRQGVRICLVEQTDRSIPFDALAAADLPLCLVIGNEIRGIRREIVEAADLAVEIPMYGMKQSLNAAVAFGIAAFACARLAAGREATGGSRRAVRPRR
jgi:tRNA G18 (ribose-2'-O)-methylase SpoU